MINKVEPERVDSPHDVELVAADAEPPVSVPRGGVINKVADLALHPGRYLVSVARTALEGLGDEPKSAVQPSSTVARRRSASGPDLAHWG